MKENKLLLTETVLTLSGVSPLDFYGADNANFRLLRSSFPKLKLVPRGDKIKVLGQEEDIISFQENVEAILDFVRHHGSIQTYQVEDILAGQAPQQLSSSSKDGMILYGRNGKLIKAKTKNQRVLVEAIEKNDVVFAVGPAGTGKTYTAVAMAVRALKNKVIKRIVLTRPAVEAGESLGYLPGDLKDKVDPYLRPLYDALDDMIPTAKLNYYMTNRIIEVAPLAFMRGRTIDDAFVILDEAQNATDLQLKMCLTRLGPSAKCIMTGDLSQIDLPRQYRSGLSKCVHILDGIKGIGVVKLTTEDVVRHRLVKHIIKAYDVAAEEEKAYKEKRKLEREARIAGAANANNPSTISDALGETPNKKD